ncbi:HipA N-terminal domain-containing protein [Bacteriovoracaceae bacterium]|nr:HipA N-terminal domain-containing protein [Bacteriovoracaceae bacterium]
MGVKVESVQVYLNNIYCGQLLRVRHKEIIIYGFVYEEEYVQKPGAIAISRSLPLRERAYISETLFPFFDGLLTEGWLKKAQSTSQKIDEDDKFSLLVNNSEDTIGSITMKNLTSDEFDGNL